MPATIDTGISKVEFEESLVHLAAASKLPAKSRFGVLPSLVQSVCGYAYQNGLSTQALDALFITIIQPNHLDQTSLTTLIKGLYPADRVPSSIVYSVVGSLGQGAQRPSPATQSHLLRWIILVHEALEEPAVLTKLYAVLFNLLDMIGIRPNLCHLLALITRRKNVKLFRIRMLLDLMRNYATEPALLGLLRVYKEFYPDFIQSSATAGRVSRFDHPDVAWRDRLRTIRDIKARADEALQRGGFAFKVVKRGAKRSNVSVIPDVHTYGADESSTTFEDVDGVQDFVEKLEKLELPSQAVSALGDSLLQEYIVLMNDHNSQRRIDHWLSLFFDGYLQSIDESEGPSRALEDVLQKLLGYAKYTKTLPKSVQEFLPRFFEQWNGQEHRDTILELLAYSPLQSFEGLKTAVLDKFEAALIDNTEISAGGLLSFYTNIIRNWTSGIAAISPSSLHIFPDPLGSLIKHAAVLALRLLATDPSVATINIVLHHLSVVAFALTYGSVMPHVGIETPSALTIYLIFFLSPTINTLSALTSLLATYKRAFRSIGSSVASGVSAKDHPHPYVSAFNGFHVDICNLLWRSRAFDTDDNGALGCLVPPAVLSALRAYTESLSPARPLNGLFSLRMNPALCAVVAAALHGTQERALQDAGDRTDIDGEEMQGKLQFLQWLEERGVGGIGDLMQKQRREVQASSG